MTTTILDYPVTIVGRELELTQEMRNHIVSSLAGIGGDYPAIKQARVTCEKVKADYEVEIVLFCAGQLSFEAETSSPSFSYAIDATIDKLDRRVRKRAMQKGKWRTRLRRPRIQRPCIDPDGMAVACLV